MESNTPVNSARVSSQLNSPKLLLQYENAEEVFREHSLKHTRYIIYRNEVFDAGEYLDRQGHPGGDAVLREYYGRDVTVKMHQLKHSKSAYKILNNYKVGEILTKVEYSIDKNAQGGHRQLEGHSLVPEELAEKVLRRFDYSKPMVPQIMDETLTLEEYIAFLEMPTIYEDPTKQARIFKSDFMELFTNTPWYAIPLFYGPLIIIFTAFNIRNTPNFCPYKAIGIVLLGILDWTFFEYLMHRFLFHSEEKLPANRFVFVFHFLFHGIHHAFPQDPGRLVFPILPGVIILSSKLYSYHLLFPSHVANFVFTGLVIGYIIYDMIHYFVHHASSLGFLENRKIYHQKHHHKNPNKGFGVSSPLWDLVFGTYLS